MRNIYNTCRDNLCCFTFAFDQIDLDKKGSPQIEKLKAEYKNNWCSRKQATSLNSENERPNP